MLGSFVRTSTTCTMCPVQTFKAWLRDHSDLVQPAGERRPRKRTARAPGALPLLEGPPASHLALAAWPPELLDLWTAQIAAAEDVQAPGTPPVEGAPAASDCTLLTPPSYEEVSFVMFKLCAARVQSKWQSQPVWRGLSRRMRTTRHWTCSRSRVTCCWTARRTWRLSGTLCLDPPADLLQWQHAQKPYIDCVP